MVMRNQFNVGVGVYTARSVWINAFNDVFACPDTMGSMLWWMPDQVDH